ncbi:ABC-2 family transporter protein [Paenibacillus konkukensis]|uniref:ABC-2 family transporter protein n=1 Tax=Paenibacillus konkukensis TaxID=2020716 RepID=A0ABY4RQ55_9BACL|nr:ABC transporter permease [Paenibacillus konkukensis]UQZ83534.1 ABC-2 family transporter protein [Paenibacillus konkukensis]
MSGFKANVINEMIKLCLRRKSLCFMALTALLPAAGAILVSRFQSGLGVTAATAADFPIWMLGLFAGLLLPLFIFMAASDMFPGELENGTAKLVLTWPVTRLNIFASKHVSMVLYICIFIALGLLSSVLASFFLEAGGSGRAAGLTQSLLAYGAAVVPLAAIGFAAMLLAQGFKSGSGALTLCILLYGLAKLAGLLYPQFVVYSPTDYTDWYMLWIGGAVAWGKIFGIASLLAGWGLICFSAGYFIYDKKQL